MANQVICYSCKNPIKTKEDLITAIYFIFIKPYHSSCYSSNLKTLRTIFLKNRPINGISGTVGAILAPLIGIFLFLVFADLKGWFFPIFILIFFVFLLPFIRLYSYYKFENPLR